MLFWKQKKLSWQQVGLPGRDNGDISVSGSDTAVWLYNKSLSDADDDVDAGHVGCMSSWVGYQRIFGGSTQHC